MSTSSHILTHLVLKALHPGIVAAGKQSLEDYNFDGIKGIDVEF